jgi:Type I phosphodiesterase / nucleotide pyrophosphatase
MEPMRIPRTAVVFVLLGGIVALVVGLTGSLVLGLAAGLVTFAIGFGVMVAISRSSDKTGEPEDPARRRFLIGAGLGGLVFALAGAPIGWLGRKLVRPDPDPIQDAMAHDLGAEYMELVRRQYVPGRSGDIQLVLQPFNSSNYPNESLSLVPDDPRTSHAIMWMYLERIPMLVHAPGFVVAGDHTDRVTLADLAPTTAQLIGYDAWPDDRAGRPLPLATTRTARRPKVVVTFVIDGGGWNVLHNYPDDWPNLKGLMASSANFRNAIHGSFPAVTACAHATIGTGTYPSQHGVSGHNIRDDKGVVRKTYRDPGIADPSDIKVSTLADQWYDATGGRAWVGEIGYQVWHLGMLGYGGRDRADGSKPVAVFWDEDGTHTWQPHNPDLYRLPSAMPDAAAFDANYEAFWAAPPDWDAEFTPQGRQSPCCSPPVVQYQGDLIEATLDAEPIGQSDTTDLLYINFKSPDYTGHVYGMYSPWVGLQLRSVDEQLGRVVDMLEARFPGEYALIVTADHGQCPLPDAKGGVRLDPIQLQTHIEQRFNGATGVVQSVVPHEVYLDAGKLWDNGGATVDDVAASLQDYRYRQNIGPYVPISAIEQELLDRKEFAAVFGSGFLGNLRDADVFVYGETAFTDSDPDGIPAIPY